MTLSDSFPVLDVRSPAEFNHAHIPGAYSLPLFSDEERKVVGTTYKQQSREQAIKIGLDFFGPKMRSMVEQVESICNSKGLPAVPLSKAKPPTVLVHCWRGGMRSAGVAWLLDLYGFNVFTLAGGYKAFRKYVLQKLQDDYDLKILGGFTGSGKTSVLKALELKGERVIDLESIACHKGSTFGAIGQPPQPSQEMFENLLVEELRKKDAQSAEDEPRNSVWLEDESQRIGLVNIPQPFWVTMRKAPVYFLEIPFEERLSYVVTSYGSLDKEKMLDGIVRIRKRLGGLEAKTAINFLNENNVRESFRVLLKYYDKYYLKALKNRELDLLIRSISCDHVEADANALKILEFQHARETTNLFYND